MCIQGLMCGFVHVLNTIGDKNKSEHNRGSKKKKLYIEHTVKVTTVC